MQEKRGREEGEERAGGGRVDNNLVMAHNPAHDLFSIGIFLCRVTPIRPNSLVVELQPVTNKNWAKTEGGEKEENLRAAPRRKEGVKRREGEFRGRKARERPPPPPPPPVQPSYIDRLTISD